MASGTELSEAFRNQSQSCAKLGSPFMASLLDAAADELERSGSIAGLLASWPGDPVADAVPLRLAAALHALVLSGTAPELAAVYPDSAKATNRGPVWRLARAAIDAHRPRVESFLSSPPQTNEVGRSAALLGGFLHIAKETGGRPMRLLEIGASAGLNQPWDQYRYDLGTVGQWGPPGSPVTLQATWEGPLPPLDAAVHVTDRGASDSAPVDLEDEEARLRLRAYVWADQPSRMVLLNAAMALTRRLGLRVEKGEAAVWVTKRLRERAAGQVTVLFHSIAWEYFPDETKMRIQEAARAAGERADVDAPFAWLRLEPPVGSGPGDGQPELRLTLWPGGEERCLAQAHTHGPPVQWYGAEEGMRHG
jgi:hypothetical protein